MAGFSQPMMQEPLPPQTIPDGMEQFLEPEYAPLIDEEYVGEAELPRRCDDLVSRCKSGMRTQAELAWFVNTKWKAGDPWYRVTDDGFGVEWLKPEKRGRYVNVNLVQEIVETLVGHMLFPPKVDARPTSADPADSFRARATQDVSNHGIRACTMEEAEGDVIEDIQTCGHGILKIGWDPTEGPLMPVWGAVLCDNCQGAQSVISDVDGISVPCYKCTAQGMLPGPPLDPGQVYEETDKQPAGEVFCERRRPWQVYTDTTDLDNVRELVDEMWMSKGEAWLKYGSLVNLSEDEMEASYQPDYPELGFGNDGFGSPSMTSDRVCVREYWSAPSEKHLRGLYGVMVGSQVITFGAMPLQYKEIPYVFLKGFDQPGSPYPKSTVDHVIGLQLALNDLVSSLRARAVQSVKPRVMADYKNNIKWEEKDGISVLKFDAGLKGTQPKEFALGAASSETVELIQFLIQWMGNVSGVTDAVKGQIEGQADSAKALAWLEDRASVRFKRQRMRIVRGMQRAVRLMLAVIKAKYADGRMINVFGASRGAATLRAFKAQDVMEPQDIELNVSPDSHLSRSARMSEVNDAMTSGALDHPVASKMMEFGGAGSFFEDKAMHEAKAVMENETLRGQGIIDEPFEGEDHEVHMKTIFGLINELRMSDPQSPLLPIAIEHWHIHQYYLQMAQGMMQQQEGAAAAGFGKQGAAQPGNQTPAAQEGAAQTGTVPDEMQAQISGEPGAPGSQASLARATAAADTPM